MCYCIHFNFAGLNFAVFAVQPPSAKVSPHEILHKALAILPETLQLQSKNAKIAKTHEPLKFHPVKVKANTIFEHTYIPM